MALDPLTPDRRRRITRDHLLDAAAQVLAERGFHGASLDEVAAAAGFTKGAVYSNFKNKEDLFLALLERYWIRESEALHQALASEIPPESRLSDFVSLIRDQLTQAPGTWPALYLEFCVYALRNPQARERLAQLNDAIVESVARIIESERARWGIESDEPPKQLAIIIEAFFRGVGIMRALDPATIDEPFLETAISFLARGMVPPNPDALPSRRADRSGSA
jgi:AcrR family transcriptional regulator